MPEKVVTQRLLYPARQVPFAPEQQLASHVATATASAPRGRSLSARQWRASPELVVEAAAAVAGMNK